MVVLFILGGKEWVGDHNRDRSEKVSQQYNVHTFVMQILTPHKSE